MPGVSPPPFDGDSDAEEYTSEEAEVMAAAIDGVIVPELAEEVFITITDPVQILVPGPLMKVEDYIIPTSGMLTSNALDAGSGNTVQLGGFVAGDPDNDPETVDLYITAGAEGYRGEGSRSRGIKSEGEAGEEVQVAASLGGTSLSTSTMGLGYIGMTSYESGGSLSTTQKLFFNYSNLSQEPNLRVQSGDIRMPGDATIKYNVTNPINYSEDEENALIAKFGYDPTLGSVEGGYTSKIKDAFDRSTNKIVESLITTYPTKLATFPRTPAMRIRKNDIAEIPEGETAEDTSPTGTAAVESAFVEEILAGAGGGTYD